VRHVDEIAELGDTTGARVKPGSIGHDVSSREVGKRFRS
jgi:hypothetical protein